MIDFNIFHEANVLANVQFCLTVRNTRQSEWRKKGQKEDRKEE